MPDPRRFRFTTIYLSWIALCAVLFVGLRGTEDPSRRPGRILSNDAGEMAVAILERRGLKGYEAVHVAYADKKWVVLCDRVPHTALEQALVVELRAVDGQLLGIRKPVK